MIYFFYFGKIIFVYSVISLFFDFENEQNLRIVDKFCETKAKKHLLLSIKSFRFNLIHVNTSRGEKGFK